jgi:mycofactocin system transcriptional regulator
MPAEPGVAVGRGRPPRTSREEVERVALRLFAARGFEETTVDDIAAALGGGRRTGVRDYASKNDIVWGDFELVLERLAADLAGQPADAPVIDSVARAAISSNRYTPAQMGELRVRMTLITSVPALQAHSMLRYADWRAVVAAYVGRRRGESPQDLIPQTVAFAALGVSMAAFSTWVAGETELGTALQDAYAGLAAGFND